MPTSLDFHEESFGLIRPGKGPALPPGDLATFLQQISPLGAPALQCALWGFRWGRVIYPMPITRPDAPRPDWLRCELRSLTRNGRPLKAQVIEWLVDMLSSGQVRPDYLPAYAPHRWSGRYPLTASQRGAEQRRVGAAVACDLGADDLRDVSARILGLRDHEITTRDQTRSDGDPRAAREYRRRGRQLLALLGVWPWAHVGLGALPDDWRTYPVFLEPLRAWHEGACGELEREAARCRSAARERSHKLRVNNERFLPRDEPSAADKSSGVARAGRNIDAGWELSPEDIAEHEQSEKVWANCTYGES